MQDSNEEKRRAQDQCIEDQRKFLQFHQDIALRMQEHAEKIELNRQSIELMKNQFAVELAQIKEDHKTIIVSLSSLQPVLDAYKKGMTIKSKLGTIAIAYIVLQFVFSRISHDQLVELIKMAL